ncbi:hypothetical protein [Candidatus Atelocyanobacterium thalassae]|uniref:Uncharacterized protein n=2 Tax=Candidatus Atelocyanobacterium thalassae TaxID=713887 RepID=A0A086CIX1_9CHRO|nr:hypothetical protein [Candidatus Atelocyanobacterium thalassa]KFF42135.1 MAG: hypothetical protein ucyna2_00199 [Candidatus Atelocyanobacterium thalassa isolate SIO64986]BDA39945.1 hypothetical protein CPARK_000078500 [cyanobacterium endosymbiont of Braarudosphaera bigelowii]
MKRLIKFPFLSLIIILLTYCSFGWYLGSSASDWSYWLGQKVNAYGLSIKNETFFLLIHLIAVLIILLIIIGLSNPDAILTVVFGSSFKSDSKAMITVFLWSLITVFLLRWIVNVSTIFLLICSTVLAKLEMQKFNISRYQIIVNLFITCFGGFGCGLLSYYEFH